MPASIDLLAPVAAADGRLLIDPNTDLIVRWDRACAAHVGVLITTDTTPSSSVQVRCAFPLSATEGRVPPELFNQVLAGRPANDTTTRITIYTENETVQTVGGHRMELNVSDQLLDAPIAFAPSSH